MRILDLGCGTAKVPGAIGLDNAALPGVDLVHDLLAFPYPVAAASLDVVYLNHVLEHFSLADGQRILREVYRMLKPGGVVHVRVPHVFSVAAWGDPTHKIGFTFISGDFFVRRSQKAYYQEMDHLWDLMTTTARVTWFNWKWYRLRQLDTVVSGWLAAFLTYLSNRFNWPGAADLLVKALPIFFVEIGWAWQKPVAPAA